MIKNIIKDKFWWIILLISILFLGIFINIQYATDTYAIFNIDPVNSLHHFLLSGRFVTAIFWWLFIIVLKLGIYKTYIISFLIAIASISFAIYKLYNLITAEIENKVVSLFISLMLILNTFLIEIFLFYEKGIMSLSILMAVIAVEFLVRYFKTSTKKYLIYAFLCLIISTFSYQGVVALFVSISVVFAIKYSKKFMDFLYKNFIIFMLYGGAAILNIIVIKTMFSNSRMADSANHFKEAFIKIIQGSKNMLVNSYGILPKYFFLVMILISVLICLYAIIFKKQKVKNKFVDILKIIYVILATLITSLAPQILMNPESVWLVARSTYPVASIVGLLLLLTVIGFNFTKKINNIITILCVVFLVVQYSGFTKISLDHYILNYNDQARAKQIREEISKYENETGNQINQIIIYYDKYISYTYPGIYANGDTNISAYIHEWSIEGVLNYDFDKKINVSFDRNEKIELKFKLQNWDFYDKEQLIFEGNILHLCVF